MGQEYHGPKIRHVWSLTRGEREHLSYGWSTHAYRYQAKLRPEIKYFNYRYVFVQCPSNAVLPGFYATQTKERMFTTYFHWEWPTITPLHALLSQSNAFLEGEKWQIHYCPVANEACIAHPWPMLFSVVINFCQRTYLCLVWFPASFSAYCQFVSAFDEACQSVREAILPQQWKIHSHRLRRQKKLISFMTLWRMDTWELMKEEWSVQN